MPNVVFSNFLPLSGSPTNFTFTLWLRCYLRPNNRNNNAAIREITALRFCASHPHIVQLLDVAVSRSSVFLVFEYYQHDLANLVSHHFAKHGKSPFSEAACKTLLLQLLDALKYLHEYDFIHRDLKLSNLLYDNGILRVADLGLSRLYMPQMTPRVASLWSRPPEVIMERPSVALPGINYGEVIDVWAVGCVWTELLRGQPLSRAQTELEQVQHILEWIPRDAPYLLRAHRDWFNREKMGDGEISWPKRSNRILDEFPFLSKEGIRLLCNLFQCDPSKRWKVKQAISSSYFQEEPLPTPVESMPYFLDISE